MFDVGLLLPLILNGPSQFAASFPPLSFPLGLLRTKSPSLNLLGMSLVLYLLAALCFETNSLKWALSLSASGFLGAC
ncbi:hypothetical protein QL285_027912 [Trifolium repens]|nr:hypothetical protein QL285_027912 [Trifolium repens]